MQNLLRYLNPIAYSAGVYGWSCDYYYIDDVDVVISTGYGPISTKNMIKDTDLIKKYEDKANKINNNYMLDYNTQKNKVNKLLIKLLKKLKEKER